MPPVAIGVIRQMLKELQELGEINEHAWILDPFGTSPRLILEAARSEYNIIVTANNPITRFIIEILAKQIPISSLQTAIAILAATRKGDERLELHIKSLYQTTCDQCGSEVIADAFVWEKERTISPLKSTGQDNQPVLSGKIYQCAACGRSGEYPVTKADIEQAAEFSNTPLHHARALQRVIDQDDPDRANVIEALEVYLPRSLYAIFTVLNKLDTLQITEQQRLTIQALILIACDLSNALWPHPGGRSRPRQLTLPSRFRENNFWLSLESAVLILSGALPPVDVTVWPVLPPGSSGICIYDGPLRDFTIEKTPFSIGMVLAIFPRPNQAFWSLSTLWAGWLWGKEAIGSFINVLRRRRFDWFWHSSALQAIFEVIVSMTKSSTPVVGVISECEPGFLSAGIIGAEYAGLNLTNLHFRAGSNQAQLSLESGSRKLTQADGLFDQQVNRIRQAWITSLCSHGEPASYQQLHAIAVGELAKNELLVTEESSPPSTVSIVGQAINSVLLQRNGLVHYATSEQNLESGQWFLHDINNCNLPLADRVEKEIVNYLIKHAHGAAYEDVSLHICQSFPGLFTPEDLLIQVVINSYAVQDNETTAWKLRSEDQPKKRRQEFEQLSNILLSLGSTLGFSVEAEPCIAWITPQGTVYTRFYVIASGIISEIIYRSKADVGRSIIVLPGGRANIVAYKLQRNPHLRHAADTGWNYLKFRYLRWLAENPVVNVNNIDSLLTEDRLSYESPQLRLF